MFREPWNRINIAFPEYASENQASLPALDFLRAATKKLPALGDETYGANQLKNLGAADIVGRKNIQLAESAATKLIQKVLVHIKVEI